MWTYKEGEREVGKGLVFFVCWLIVQTVVIIILEGLHLLPGDLLGVELRPRYYLFARVDVYTTMCGLVGVFYTGVGCVIMRLHEVNSSGWWLRMIGWYLLYLLLTYPLFYDEVGWRVADVWFAPVLWVGEIELVYHIQKKVSINRNTA